MLFVALAFVFILIAATRPGPGRMFRGRYRPRPARGHLHRFDEQAPDPTSGLRDPHRPL